MPRQVRIEFEGAFYHVMARGDRREDIFLDDRDREMFLATLEEACVRTGWKIHAYVLMGNHYHLVVETPLANLVVGMTWLQGTYTIRFNTRHGLSGHLFGGRYKAIVVQHQGGPYFARLIDYVHLNPVRAGIVKKRQPLERYKWSSLGYYVVPPSKRRIWQVADNGLEACASRDTARGRRHYLETLGERIRWEQVEKAGLVEIEGQSLQSTLRRGWYFGSQEFREELAKKAERVVRSKKGKGEDGYRGAELKDRGERDAEAIIASGLAEFGLKKEELGGLRKNDWRKGLLAHLMRRHTTVSLDWISQRLEMGARSAVSRNASGMGRRLVRERKLKRLSQEILKNIKN